MFELGRIPQFDALPQEVYYYNILLVHLYHLFDLLQDPDLGADEGGIVCMHFVELGVFFTALDMHFSLSCRYR